MNYRAEELTEKQGVVQSSEAILEKMASWFQTVAWFTQKMLNKMLLNKHKSGWQSLSLGYLRYRVGTELLELDECLNEWQRKKMNKDLAAEIANECADTANFLMMLADRARIMSEEEE
jgi:hypothetical protein